MKRIVPLLAALPLAPRASLHAADTSKPNILVILADDLGRGDYSAFGTQDNRTPNIDRLCREGMTFQNFYANCCVCSPTRAALLTGCFPDRVGVPGVIREETPSDSWGYLSARATLLPQVLKPAGYHSAIVGKWHLGIGSPNTPTERGFDFFHGFLGDMIDDYWTHLRHGHNFMRRNQEVVDPKGHATDIFTEWACEYLFERAKSPETFFLYLAYNAPHDPIQPHIDSLAQVRMKFTSFYVHQRCSPSRLAFMTGCYAHRVGTTKVIYPRDRIGINPDEITTPELLKTAGDTCGSVGKWHLGNWEPFHPLNHGFDYFKGAWHLAASESGGASADEDAKEEGGAFMENRTVLNATYRKCGETEHEEVNGALHFIEINRDPKVIQQIKATAESFHKALAANSRHIGRLDGASRSSKRRRQEQ